MNLKRDNKMNEVQTLLLGMVMCFLGIVSFLWPIRNLLINILYELEVINEPKQEEIRAVKVKQLTLRESRDLLE